MGAETPKPKPSQRPFWREEDPILGPNGELLMGGMWSHQRQWWELPNFIRVLVTGFGGGKTMMLGKRMISLALTNAPVPCITVSPTYPMAETTIVQTIDELLHGKCSGSLDMTYRLRRSMPHRFDIRWRGRHGVILCMSGEHPDRLKGSNIAAAGIDEPFMQRKAVFEQVIARLRHPSAVRRELNLTGTPEGVVGWGFELCEGDLRPKYDVGIVQCSSSENRSLPADYVQRLRTGYDDAAVAAYVDGKFINLSSGQVYYGFDPTVNVVDPEMPDGAEWGAGMDFNVDPMAFCVFWRKGDRMHFVREYEQPNSDSVEAAATLRQDFPKLKRIYPDASGKRRSTSSPRGVSDFHHLRDAGFEILARPSNPALRDRYNAVNGALRHSKVTIGSACRKLRSYLLGYSHEEMHRDSQKAMGHLLDAFGYPIHYLLPVDRTAAKLVGFGGA